MMISVAYTCKPCKNFQSYDSFIVHLFFLLVRLLHGGLGCPPGPSDSRRIKEERHSYSKVKDEAGFVFGTHAGFRDTTPKLLRVYMKTEITLIT